VEYVVADQKIVGYLLTNPGKCGFFLLFGYSVENLPRLHNDILTLARNFPHDLRRTTPHGEEYEIIGQVEAPNGRMIRDAGIMSFVTAYPA
jgi:hypothetical protein